MAISGIGASTDYSAAKAANVSATRSSSTSTSSSSTSSGISMTDFLKLLAAQFENQDVMNPTDNTEYISELAQFSSIQAMNTLTTSVNHQYAASLVGKTVRVSGTDEAGKTTTETGLVSYADFSSSSGADAIVVNGRAYDVSSVVQVLGGSSSGAASGGSGGSAAV